MGSELEWEVGPPGISQRSAARSTQLAAPTYKQLPLFARTSGSSLVLRNSGGASISLLPITRPFGELGKGMEVTRARPSCSPGPREPQIPEPVGGGANSVGAKIDEISIRGDLGWFGSTVRRTYSFGVRPDLLVRRGGGRTARTAQKGNFLTWNPGRRVGNSRRRSVKYGPESAKNKEVTAKFVAIRMKLSTRASEFSTEVPWELKIAGGNRNEPNFWVPPQFQFPFGWLDLKSCC